MVINTMTQSLRRCGVYFNQRNRNDIVPTWASFACAAVAFGGTLLVVLASLERILGRPIPRFKYSKPVPKQRVFIVVPTFMIVALIGALIVLLPMRMCSQRPAPSAYQQFLMVIAFLVFAAGIAGSSGFVVFLIVWIGNVVWRATATELLHRVRSR